MEKEKKKSSTFYRVVVGIGTIPLIIVITVLGNYAFLAFSVIVVSFLAYEIFNLIFTRPHEAQLPVPQISDNKISRFIFILSSVIIVISVYFQFIIIAAAVLIIIFIYFLFQSSENAVKLFAALFYIAVPFAVASLMVRDEFILLFFGNYILVIFILVWGTDTASYFAGRKFGRNKLAPSISPGKTIEGSVAGFIATFITGLIIYFIKIYHFELTDIIIISGITAVTSQTGDLVESYIKRRVNVKDSSHIIPGHGGVLDRFDSFIFTVPFVFIYLFFKYIY